MEGVLAVSAVKRAQFDEKGGEREEATGSQCCTTGPKRSQFITIALSVHWHLEGKLSVKCCQLDRLYR